MASHECDCKLVRQARTAVESSLSSVTESAGVAKESRSGEKPVPPSRRRPSARPRPASEGLGSLLYKLARWILK